MQNLRSQFSTRETVVVFTRMNMKSSVQGVCEHPALAQLEGWAGQQVLDTDMPFLATWREGWATPHPGGPDALHHRHPPPGDTDWHLGPPQLWPMPLDSLLRRKSRVPNTLSAVSVPLHLASVLCSSSSVVQSDFKVYTERKEWLDLVSSACQSRLSHTFLTGNNCTDTLPSQGICHFTDTVCTPFVLLNLVILIISKWTLR
ncbi:hypothetical protein H920_04783 [Fukomys damarensis]|uniref:Uncharacterized protein n=1 Tax=Fukomys damarensis TaxID=885580 RepID=A0A091DNT7_FUKDA|nr:hypothetical protein H920_04783 [Fukomys damarensis]